MDTSKLKIYYDAEFTGLHRNTTLISIGMVSESGASFYAEFTDYDETQVNPWLKENVIDHLMIRDTELLVVPLGKESKNYRVLMGGNKKKVTHELLGWLKNESDVVGKQIQFYTDCYAYDWVLLNDLICDFGVAINTPDFVNYIPIDLSTMLFDCGIDPDITREDFITKQQFDLITRVVFPLDFAYKHPNNHKHNSLWDAYVAKACFEKLDSIRRNEHPTLRCLGNVIVEDESVSIRDSDGHIIFYSKTDPGELLELPGNILDKQVTDIEVDVDSIAIQLGE